MNEREKGTQMSHSTSVCRPCFPLRDNVKLLPTIVLSGCKLHNDKTILAPPEKNNKPRLSPR